jgi:PilZ domain
MERERRRVPRFQFIAPAELVEEASGARLKSWVADIGLQGCSLSEDHAPRAGSVVRLKIGTHPRECFQASAVIVYSGPKRAGLFFREVKPASKALLQTWLADAKFPKVRPR